MSDCIEFSVPAVPPTINALSRKHWSFRVAKKKLWMDELRVGLGLINRKDLQDWKGRLRIEIHVIHNRSFDPDNLKSAAKIPLDALKGLGCLVDDSHAHIDLEVTQELKHAKVTRFRITKT